MVKNPPANAGDVRDAGSIPGSGSSLGGGHGNPLQYSCLENPMDGGAWRAIVHACLVSQSCQTLCDSMDCHPGSSVHGDSSGKDTGVGCHVLLQGIFLTQPWVTGVRISYIGRQVLYHLAPPGKPQRGIILGFNLNFPHVRVSSILPIFIGMCVPLCEAPTQLLCPFY